MAQTGAMVQSWPFSPGCDAAGIIVKTGPNAVSAQGKRWENGDRVFGCTRLGTRGHSPWAEWFLMDARLAIPVPPNISLEQASTLGVALLTAGLGVWGCLGVRLLDSTARFPQSIASDGRWALVLGGASSVGYAAVQLLIACGFRVVATCSERSRPGLEKLGVRCVSYALPQEELIAAILRHVEGAVGCVFDAVGSNSGLIVPLVAAMERSAEGAGAQEKMRLAFTTTNAFAPLPDAEGLEAEAIQLGPIGQDGPEARALNDALACYIPVLYKLLGRGTVGVGPYQVVGERVEGIPEAWEIQKAGKVAGKVVVKVASE